MNQLMQPKKSMPPSGFAKSAVLIGICALTSGCWPGECYPPLPPLLRDLTADSEGEVWSPGSCALPEGKQQAYSPELTSRLQARFPGGSDAAPVERDLLAMGFRVVSPCPNVPSDRLAQFLQKGCAFPMDARITWQVTEDGKIAGLSGDVFYKPGPEYR